MTWRQTDSGLLVPDTTTEEWRPKEQKTPDKCPHCSGPTDEILTTAPPKCKTCKGRLYEMEWERVR